MKFWYSVKTHKPATSGCYLVYQDHTGYVFPAHVEHFNDGTFSWTDFENPEYLKGITYFANIPPLPIEEENE